MRPPVAARFESFLALRAQEFGWEGVEQACRIALELVDEAWGSPLAAFYFLQDGSGWLISSFGPQPGKLLPLAASQIRDPAWPIRHLLDGGNLVRTEGATWPFPGLDSPGQRSVETLAVPLIAHGRTLGGLVLAWDEPYAELPESLLPIQLVAWHVAVLIDQSELVERLRSQTEALEDSVVKRSRQLGEALDTVHSLYAHSQAQLERLKAFTEISMRINSHAELGPLLDAVAELAARLLDAAFAFTGMLQPDGSYRVIPEAGHWGVSDRFIAEFETVPGKGLHFEAIKAGGPVACNDVFEDRRSTNSLVREEGFRAEIVAPLMVGRRPIGILAAGQKEPRVWTEDEIAVLQFLSSQAAAAVDRARTLDELRALDHLKDEILGIASHELRTPLTAIKGFAAILAADQGDLEPESSRKYAHIIDVEADRMIRLVDDMLNVSRIESGRVSLELLPLNVHELVEQAIYASWGTSADRIEVEVDESIETMADSDQLVRILANLLENARKYSEPGSRVAVRARADGDVVEIRVWNEGDPFAPGEIEQLFQKFSRLGRHRASGARGAGLGLYIARQLLSAMGGLLWVEPTPGGPTFAFSLPAVKHGLEVV